MPKNPLLFVELVANVKGLVIVGVWIWTKYT